MTRFGSPLETNSFVTIPCSRVYKSTYSYSCPGSWRKYTGSIWELMQWMIEKTVVPGTSRSIPEVISFFTLNS